jgi:hypothetical protein
MRSSAGRLLRHCAAMLKVLQIQRSSSVIQQFSWVFSIHNILSETWHGVALQPPAAGGPDE